MDTSDKGRGLRSGVGNILNYSKVEVIEGGEPLSIRSAANGCTVDGVSIKNSTTTKTLSTAVNKDTCNETKYCGDWNYTAKGRNHGLLLISWADDVQ